jgi:hypothetical protein
MLVRFRDVRDPKTVEKVDPDDLAASFGPGVVLRRITVQLTDDPVTTGLADTLPWVTRTDGYYLDSDFVPTTKPTFAQQIAIDSFQRSMK